MVKVCKRWEIVFTIWQIYVKVEQITLLIASELCGERENLKFILIFYVLRYVM